MNTLSQKDKATVFKEYFNSVFKKDNDACPMPVIYKFNDEIISDISFTHAQLFFTLHNLDVNKSCGPDGLSLRVQKECCAQLAPSLVALFNKSMGLGQITTTMEMC